MKQRRFGRKFAAMTSAAVVLVAGANAWAWLGDRASTTSETLQNQTPVWITRSAPNAATDLRVPTNGDPFPITVTVHNDRAEGIYMAVLPAGGSIAYDGAFFCPAGTITTTQVDQANAYEGIADVNGNHVIPANSTADFTLQAHFVNQGPLGDPAADQTECQGETLTIDFGTLVDGWHYGLESDMPTA